MREVARAQEGPARSLDESGKHTPIDIAFKSKRGWPCPGPRTATTAKQPYLQLAIAVTKGTLVVPATFDVAAATVDATAQQGIDAAIAHATASQKVRARRTDGSGGFVDEPSVVARFDLDRDGTNEIIVRDTELFLIYDAAGQPLAGSVGCYFPG